MTTTIQYRDTTIPYILIKKPIIKNITISIDPTKGVTVTAPRSITMESLNSVLQKKSSWIAKKLSAIQQATQLIDSKQYITGELFPYLGEDYPLTILPQTVRPLSQSKKKPSLVFQDKHFYVAIPPDLTKYERTETIKCLLKQWYILQGQTILKDRLELYCPLMHVQPKSVTFKEQKKRWGSCTSNGVIYLNWRLMTAPLPLLDYVLVHELAHLKHMNHSKDFWSFVQTIIPDYKQKRKSLKDFGIQLLSIY
ncbi:hypothetical protein BHU72_13660 [Desulfuribacillus stibiiarsenatis]|uniref:YgjP-like metallopeptidase domain-containing protein n=1 Tax=Desulfuribacillus stibiiarsenatis TaxID=1390249 RepID=A0A1E5L8I4_9FIRM|nr:SprT family zinc-dependent metalloprotease [Desulfuribacillus stibiiarsenatis]OEH86460.1 hypothetical protein BHU72_13660 [Desulfuribacillus stibiiarsenatis]